MVSRYLLGFAASLLCCAAALTQTGAQTGDIEIKDIWARATPGGAENGAAYVTLMSSAGDRLTGATTPAAARAELHRMTMDGSVMRMREVSAIDLPPGTPVTLKPGGLHIMMIGLKQPLHPGQWVKLTLTFEKAGTREVSAAIGKAGAMGPETHSGSMHDMQKPASR